MRRSTAVFVAAAYLVYASLLTPCRPCLWVPPDLRPSAREKGYMRRSTAGLVSCGVPGVRLAPHPLPALPATVSRPQIIGRTASARSFLKYFSLWRARGNERATAMPIAAARFILA